jgi:hypothetical protein
MASTTATALPVETVRDPDPRRWQALALVCVAFFMTVLDGTIVTVALPSIKFACLVSCAAASSKRPANCSGVP